MAELARSLGYLPNAELWAHKLNVQHDDMKDVFHITSGEKKNTIVSSAERIKVLLDMAKNMDVPGCEKLPLDASLQVFCSLRRDGLVEDPLELHALPGPAMSPLAVYDGMRFSPRDALAVEIANGPEVPVALRGSALIDFHPSLVYNLRNRFPSPYTSGCDEDRLMGLAKMLGTISCTQPSDLRRTTGFSSFPPIDRIGTLSNGLKCKVLWPVPPFDPAFSLTIDEVMRRRVDYLLQTYPRLHVMWSGGIDTTALITAFFRAVGTGREIWEKRGLSVHYSRRSIEENPAFYEAYIRHLPGGEFQGHCRDFMDGSRTVVTGEPADMLFGTTWMARCFKFKETDRGELNPLFHALEEPWENVIPECLRTHCLLASGAEAEEAWLAWIRPWVAKAPIPIVNLFDFCWWVAFGLKWQHDMVRSVLNKENVTQELWDSIVHFYCTEEWQQWSYHAHKQNMQNFNVWASYKWPLKDYISRYTGDTEYHAAKIKVQSATYAFGFQLGLDDSFSSISFGALSVSAVRMREKYGDELEKFVVST